MIETYGLTHLALGVRDLDRTLAFYSRVFGSVPVYQSADFLQLQTPGTAASSKPSLTLGYPCNADRIPVCNRGSSTADPGQIVMEHQHIDVPVAPARDGRANSRIPQHRT